MTRDKAIKHTARTRVGCGWHIKIKKGAKKDASRAARRLFKVADRAER